MLNIDKFEYATDMEGILAWMCQVLQDIAIPILSSAGLQTDTNHRQVYPAAAFSESGVLVAVKFKGYAYPYTINSCSIGLRSGATGNFDGNPTRITFGGNNSGIIPAGGFLISDIIFFPIDKTKDYLIHIYGNAAHESSGVFYGWISGGSYYADGLGVDYTFQNDVSALSLTNDGYQILISDIFIYGGMFISSESTIKKEGTYSLKIIAPIMSLSKTLTKIFSPTWNLSGQTLIKFWVRASRIGSNFKLGFHDSGGTTTEVTPNITTANTWQLVTLDISAVADTDKDAIDSIILTILNADAENTIYLDNLYADDGSGGGSLTKKVLIRK
jgi:hypothetical protein